MTSIVTEINLEETLPLRSQVLRNGLSQNECTFPQDGLLESMHFGLQNTDRQGEGKIIAPKIIAPKIIAVVSFYQRPLESDLLINDLSHLLALPACQLRGMAVAEGEQGKGLGKILVEKAIEHPMRMWGAIYCWCDARRVAYNFYERMGFQFVSDEFEIPNFGPAQENAQTAYVERSLARISTALPDGSAI